MCNVCLFFKRKLENGVASKQKTRTMSAFLGNFRPPPPPPKTRTFLVFFPPIFCWFLGDRVQIRDPKHSFLAFPESVQKVVGSISKIGQFFDHLNF